MALTAKELKEIRKAIEESHRPLIFFDDDCDGLSSFLQVYKFVGEGRGIPVKDSPEVSVRYAKKVEEYQPDLVLIVDKPQVSQDFLDRVRQKVIWLDHHDPQSQRGADYYNPRVHDDKDNSPTSYWVYKALKKDLWIAMTGIVADWHFPKDIVKDFRKKYPELLPKEIKTAPQALFNSKLGKLVRIWSFNLKGTVKDTMSSVKILTRIEGPYEILEQNSSRGRYIYRKFSKLWEKYKSLLDAIKISREKLVLFTYKDDSHSFTSDLSNEILYRHPDKLIIIGRIDQGEVKCSLRCSKVNIAKMLEQCLQEVRGYGGGHPQACGACIHQDDFSEFISCIKEKLK